MNAWLRIMLIVGLIPCSGLISAQQREREPARCVGKLRGLAPGVLQVETDKGERMLVAIEARPEGISFQGVATPAFVRPGMLVQFEASLDKKGEAQEEIGTIKVVSPRMGIQLGLLAGGGFGGKELFAGTEDESGKKKKKNRADASPYLVTGTVRSINNGKMYVAAGATVKAELSSNCQVSFDISDISLARDGDSVEVTDGWRYANQSNQIHARRVTITAEKPLGAEDKKRRPAAKAEEKKSEEKKSEEKTPAAEAKKDLSP